MKKVFPILALVVTASGSSALSLDNDYVVGRQGESVATMKLIDEARRELAENERLLISLRTTLPAGAIDALSRRARVGISGVFICDARGGVLGVYLDPAIPFGDQIAARQTELLGVVSDVRGASNFRSGDAGRPVLPSLDAYCGIELRGTWSQLKAFRTSVTKATFMSEVVTLRMRKLPVNIVFP